MVFSMMAHRGAPGGDGPPAGRRAPGGSSASLRRWVAVGSWPGARRAICPSTWSQSDGLPGREAVQVSRRWRAVWLPPKMDMRDTSHPRSRTWAVPPNVRKVLGKKPGIGLADALGVGDGARVPGAAAAAAAARAMTTRWSFLPWATLPPGKLGHAPGCARPSAVAWATRPPRPWRWPSCHGGQAVALLQAQALGVEDAGLPLAEGGADGQGGHHVGDLGGVDGDAPQAAGRAHGPAGVAGGGGSPPFQATGLQAEAGGRAPRRPCPPGGRPRPEPLAMATGAAVGDSAAMHRKKAAWDQSPSTWAAAGGVGAGRRGPVPAPGAVAWAVTPYSLKHGEGERPRSPGTPGGR